MDFERGAIDVAGLDGPFDLQATLESGQTYLWWRADGRTFEDDDIGGSDAWYETVVGPMDGLLTEPTVLRVRQVGSPDDGRLEWEATTDPVPALTHLLRLDDDLDAVLSSTADLDLLDRACDAYRGMRLVRDPPFPCLVSFICSAQMHVSRIHGMQRRLREQFGRALTVDGDTYRAFPSPATLAGQSEAALRELKLGYRAPYVRRSAELVADGEAHPAAAADREYEAAREYLTQFVGVGEKVADCVLLFSLEFTEAVPLDTWIRTAIADYFPDCEGDGYADTSRRVRERLGGEYAGYAQTYVFFYLRRGGE